MVDPPEARFKSAWRRTNESRRSVPVAQRSLVSGCCDCPTLQYRDMEPALLDAFIADVKATRELAFPLAGSMTTTRMHVQRTENGWQGRGEEVPDVYRICRTLRDSGHAIGQLVDMALQAHHPERHEMRLPMPYAMHSLNGFSMVSAALERLWRHGPLESSEEDVGELARIAVDFVERPILKLRYFAPLLGFKLADASEPFSLALGGPTIRQIEDSEASMLYNPHRPSLPQSVWVITREFEHDAREQYDVYDARERTPAFSDVARTLTALRVWGPGGVAAPTIWFAPDTWQPVLVGTHSYDSREAHFSPYEFDPAKAGGFLQLHAALSRPGIHDSLRLGVDRLRDAEGRREPRDALVDAVVGLEAILLHVAGREEMSYRFRLYYAALHPPAERTQAYERAQAVYAARSAIVHGGGKRSRKAPNYATLANDARAMLRWCIKRFLGEGPVPGYVSNARYWDELVLGLPK